MKIKALVHQNIVETYVAELSDEEIQKLLDECSLARDSGTNAGKLITLDEVHKVFLGTMQNFLVTNSCGKTADLYTVVSEWAVEKAKSDKNPDKEIEDFDSSATMIE